MIREVHLFISIRITCLGRFFYSKMNIFFIVLYNVCVIYKKNQTDTSDDKSGALLFSVCIFHLNSDSIPAILADVSSKDHSIY